MSTGYTTVAAASLQDATGALVTNATITFTPVNTAGQPLSFRAGTPSGAVVVASAVSAQVVNGAFSIQLCDTSLTNPVNVGYEIKLIDNASKEALPLAGYNCVQPSGTNFDLDQYAPGALTGLPMVQGPQGVQGAPGVGSLPQLAAVRNKLLPGVNLYNTAADVVGSVYDQTGTVTAIAGFQYSDLIPANSGGEMMCNKTIPQVGIIFCGTDGSAQGTTGALAANTPFAVPATCAFVRLNLASSDAAALMLVNGTVLPPSYVSFGTIAPSQVAALISASPLNATVASLQSEVSTALPPDISGNLFNLGAVHGDNFVDPTTGQLVSTAGAPGNFTSSDYIVCKNAGNLAVNFPFQGNGQNAGVSFYDQNHNFIGAYTATSGPGSFPVSSAAYYCRMWWITAQVTLSTAIVVAGTTVPAYSAYNTNAGNPTVKIASSSVVPSRWAGKSFGVFGTSITAFGVWQAQIAAAKGMTLAFDASIAGSETGQAFDKLFATTGQALPSSGGPINMAALSTALASVDGVFIEYGTNDVWGIEYNSFAQGTDASPASEASSMGYVEKLLVTLRTAKPDLIIIWISPYHTERYPGVPVLSGEEVNSHYTDAYLYPWFGYLQAKCMKKGVPIIDQRFNQIDMYTMCNISTGAPNMLRDKLHPSDKGFADCMSPFISRALELYARSI